MAFDFVCQQHQFTGRRRIPLEVCAIHSRPQTVHVPLDSHMLVLLNDGQLIDLILDDKVIEALIPT